MSLLRRADMFRRDQRALAIVEFAMIVPVLALLVVSGAESAKYLRTRQHFETTKDTLGRLVSRLGSPDLATTTVTNALWSTMADMVPLLLPEALEGRTVRGDWLANHNFGLAISYVRVITEGGITKPYVAWSMTNRQAMLRSCGEIATQSDDAETNPAAIPQSLASDGSALIVDLTFTYQAGFGESFTLPLTFNESAYFAPRNVNDVVYQPGGRPGGLFTLNNCSYNN